MTANIRASYDEVPYRSLPLRQTHPDHLATVGSLFGFAAARVDRCRVLELGCASGGNLIPMAVSYPDSEFVGIDLSPVQINEGVADVQRLALGNIRLLSMDVLEFDAAFGMFDYVIAHGIYSWVPPKVQESILELCARQLAPEGIAIVSYNTLPGWRMLAIVRDAMRRQSRGIADAKARIAQARATLAFLGESVQGDDSAYAKLLRMAAENLRQKPDYYVLHEYLEETNEALYFHEFIERVERHHLRYLGEADVKLMLSTGLPAPTLQTLNRIASDLMEREQLLDFLRNRTFRQTLLIREGPPLDRKVSAERVKSLWIAAPFASTDSLAGLSSGDALRFQLPDGRGLEVQNPISKAAFLILAERWPLAISFPDLYSDAASRLGARLGDVDQRDLLAAEILRCFARDAVELHCGPSPFVLTPGLHPEACPLARLQAAREASVTNRRHEVVPLDEESRAVLSLLEGTRTAPEIAAIRWPELPADERVARFATAVAKLGRQALLVR